MQQSRSKLKKHLHRIIKKTINTQIVMITAVIAGAVPSSASEFSCDDELMGKVIVTRPMPGTPTTLKQQPKTSYLTSCSS